MFEADLDFSRPWFSEIKVQIKRPHILVTFFDGICICATTCCVLFPGPKKHRIDRIPGKKWTKVGLFLSNYCLISVFSRGNSQKSVLLYLPQKLDAKLFFRQKSWMFWNCSSTWYSYIYIFQTSSHLKVTCVLRPHFEERWRWWWQQICISFVDFLQQSSSNWCQALKSDNLQYDTLVCWFIGTNDLLTKRLMFQVFFSWILCKNGFNVQK